MRLSKRILCSAVFAAAAITTAAAQAPTMVFVSWGGQTQDVQKAIWVEPFSKQTGTDVLQDGPTDYGKLKAMVDAGSVQWDVVDVEGDFAGKAGHDGLLEPIDFSVVDRTHLDPRFVTDYSVGSFAYSFVVGYSKDTFGNETPKGWADLFDVAKFPGKRALYKWSAPGVLEGALLADGVEPDKLYPLDLDRAFAKLDTIKSDIVWWSSGAQSQQLLASAEAPIGQFWCGRMFLLQQSGENVGISWENSLTAADSLVVPKGTKNKDAAMKFIAMATSPKLQADFASQSGNSPINLAAMPMLPKEYAASLPDQQQGAHQITLDMGYWAKHRDEIASRWYAWQSK